MAQSVECINEGFFSAFLNHFLQAYVLLCTSLLFKRKMDNLQVGWPGCHVIAKLIFVAFCRRPEILANRASSANRASPAHVIGPLDGSYVWCSHRPPKLALVSCSLRTKGFP